MDWLLGVRRKNCLILRRMGKLLEKLSARLSMSPKQPSSNAHLQRDCLDSRCGVVKVRKYLPVNLRKQF